MAKVESRQVVTHSLQEKHILLLHTMHLRLTTFKDKFAEFLQ